MMPGRTDNGEGRMIRTFDATLHSLAGCTRCKSGGAYAAACGMCVDIQRDRPWPGSSVAVDSVQLVDIGRLMDPQQLLACRSVGDDGLETVKLMHPVENGLEAFGSLGMARHGIVQGAVGMRDQ